jgi:hypothetical protein
MVNCYRGALQADGDRTKVGGGSRQEMLVTIIPYIYPKESIVELQDLPSDPSAPDKLTLIS